MGWKRSTGRVARPASRGGRTVLTIVAALLLATPVSAWYILEETEVLAPFSADEAKPFVPTWPGDLDGDRIDDRLPERGVASVIVPFTRPVQPAELQALEAIPSVQVIHSWSIVDGAWVTLDLDAASHILALPFVKRIEADPILTPTLDVTTRAMQAQDARSGILADGTEFDFVSRGVWRRDATLQGITGAGVTVALLDGGIDDRHPALDDMDDDLATADLPKVAAKLNVWAYAFLNATVGQAQEVNSSYPYVIADPGPQPDQPIPNECNAEPTVGSAVCFTVKPTGGAVLAYTWPQDGGPMCVYAAGCVPANPVITRYPKVDGMDVIPNNPGVPGSPLPPNANQIAGEHDLFFEPPFSALPHSTSLASAIAGTGDSQGTPSGATLLDRWGYAGVAPGARLVDVNLFVGIDPECAPVGEEVAAGGTSVDTACPLGPRGSSRGVQVGSGNAALAQTGATLVTGAEMVQRYNEQHSDPARPAIGVAVIPLLDIQSCSADSHDTLIEAAVDALAQTNVTVITSVGQDQSGICVPANVPRTLAVGARDGMRTISDLDDEAWDDMSVPHEDQEGVAKPDVTVPGVRVWTARSAPNDFYEVTGSSVAAAQAAGVAALVLEAGNRTMQGLALKSHLIQTADGGFSPGLDPQGYADAGNEPDGLRDGGARRGWQSQWGFGGVHARNAVCSVAPCPLPWESLQTAVLPDPAKPFPLSGHVTERITFVGRAIVDDPRAGAFWLDRPSGQHYTPLGGVGPGAHINFAFTDEWTTDSSGRLPLTHTVTKPDGSFNLTFEVPADKRPGALFCILWVEELAQTDARDGLSRSPGLPCALSVFSKSSIAIDLCGEDEACDPAHPVVSFLDDPSVDYLRGIVTLSDASGQILEDQLLRVQWEGAEEAYQDISLRTAQNTGEALIKLPLRGEPGIFLLNISFVPPPGDFHDPATLLVPITVSVGTQADIDLVGREPGSVLLNDGTTLPVAVSGVLQTFLGEPIPRATVELVVEGRLQRSLGTARTDEQGRFSLGLDARPLQSGAYGLYVRYQGEKTPTGVGYTLLPTTSYRIPFTVVVQPELHVAHGLSGHRGEAITINGTATNPFGRPLGNETIVATWIGGTSLQQEVKTDRSGRFTFTRTLPKDEPLGPLLVAIQYTGSPELAPAETLRSVDVLGRSALSIFPGEVRRGSAAHLQGFLYDDTGRPLVGQKVAVEWGSLHVGNATTDSLGHYGIGYNVPADERAGPVTVRVAYAGRSFIEASNAQGVIGVLAPTDLEVTGGERSANQVLEFSTRLVDDQDHVITDPQDIQVFIAPPRDSDLERVTHLSPMDLSSALAPELRLSHAYRLATGFGVSDGARVQVSLDAGRSWTTVTPRDGYPDQASSVFDGPAFNGETSGWFPQQANLTAYANEADVRLRWRAATSPLNNDLALGIDDVVLADGNKTLFSDDFERFGAKQGANYWSIPPAGGLVLGRESFTGGNAGVLASNLADHYGPRLQLSALGPAVNLPANGPTYAALRYRLDTGNAQDYATVSLRLGNDSILLSPVNEPQYGQMPETSGKWRWLLYELPAASRGRQAHLAIAFQSDGLLGGEGLQVDEVRMLRGPEVLRAPITAEGTHWTFNNFGAGLPHDVDTYVASQDTRPYLAPASPTLRKFDTPILLGLGQMPFPLTFFGESYDRLTVYPEGVAALGDTLGQDPSAICRELPSGQACHLAEVPGFGAPLVAPAWDTGLASGNAFLATSTIGEEPNRQFVLEWRGLQAPDAPAGSTVRFAAIFHEDGDIEFRYGTLFFGNEAHDLGANATIGVGQPGIAGRTVEVHSHAPVLTDNLRIYLARVDSHPTQQVQSTCPPAQAPCLVIAPNPAGTYKAGATSEAIFESGLDLSKANQAYLVTRQFVDLGRGDTLTIAARPFGSNSWRNLPVMMGGQTTLSGAFQPDRPGEWSTVVYDLSSLVGQRAKIRFQVNADGAGQDVGILVRDLSALLVPRTPQAAMSDSFDSYLDTTGGGATWWSSRRAGQGDAQPPWSVMQHGTDRPTELGSAFLGLGGDGQALEASSQFMLTSPPFDLRNSKQPVLQWWQRFAPTDDLDGAVLEVSTDGGVSFRPLRPEGDGYDDRVPTLNGIGWGGPQFGFVTDTFDLTPFTGSDVRIRLDLGLGEGPFPALWILDELTISDRLGLGAPFLAEDGGFGPRWDRDPAWQSLPQASAIAWERDGIPAATTLHVTGATTQHRIALPDDAPRGMIQATMLFRGASETFGGAISSAQLLLQAEAQFSGLQVANDKDGRGHLLRGRTFTLEGQLRALDGQALSDRLVQLELAGVPIGSARTGADGRFETVPLQVLGTMPLGKHTLRVEYGGDLGDHVQGAVVDLPVSVKALAQLRIESQVARGDELDVVVAILDDLGKPLARTAAVVAVTGQEEEMSVVTDSNGLARFSTPVTETASSEVAFEVRALGSQDVLGTSLVQSTVVPPAPDAPIWPYVLAGALLLAAALAALAYVLLRRRKLESLQEALAKELEATRYQLQTGDAVRESIFALYRAFLGVLARAGRPVTPQQTANEVAAVLASVFSPAQRAEVDILTGLFSEARYSEATMGEDDRRRALACVQRLEAALSPAPVAAPAGGTPA